jgi:DNA-binding transcriptional MerR regulator
MLTVTQLARTCGLSRTALLYYESIGLLPRPRRTPGNYRSYSEADVERLRRICIYRNAGVKLAGIRVLLDRTGDDAVGVLRRRLEEIDAEVERLRGHQRAILKLLEGGKSRWRAKVITKEKWVSIMKSAGFSEDDMHRWHTEFERSAPEEHQEFLEFLHIPPGEIRAIRDWSRRAVS